MRRTVKAWCVKGGARMVAYYGFHRSRDAVRDMYGGADLSQWRRTDVTFDDGRPAPKRRKASKKKGGA